MIARESISFRRIYLWCIIIVCGLLAACLGLISLVSVWVGFMNTNQHAFWVPIVVGATSLTALFCIIPRIVKCLLTNMKEKVIVNISATHPWSTFPKLNVPHKKT